MKKVLQRLSDERVEQIIGNLLRFSVILAATIVIIGGIAYTLRYGKSLPDYNVFNGEPKDLRTLSGIIKDSVTFHSRGIIQLGLLLLIATPVARVLFSVFAFWMQRDRTYVVVTLIVLAVLAFSLAGGRF